MGQRLTCQPIVDGSSQLTSLLEMEVQISVEVLVVCVGWFVVHRDLEGLLIVTDDEDVQ